MTTQTSPKACPEFRFEFQALEALAEHNINLLAGVTSEDFKDPKKVMLFAWAGLLYKDDAPKLEDISKHLRGVQPRLVFKEITLRLTEALTDPDAKSEDEDKATDAPSAAAAA